MYNSCMLSRFYCIFTNPRAFSVSYQYAHFQGNFMQLMALMFQYQISYLLALFYECFEIRDLEDSTFEE